jgi:hypothetical protein
LGLIRPWAQAPRDPALSSETFDWQTWVTQAVNHLQGSATPIPAPSGVATLGYPNGVQITWNEIPLGLADRYVVYENTIDEPGGTVVGSVAANLAGTINKFFRSGLTDTNTRFYSVQGYSGTTGGATSARVKGKASLISLNAGVTNMDQILDGLSFQRPVIGNSLAPDLPYNGDFEQFPDTATVADGWSVNANQVAGSPTYGRSNSPFRGNYAQQIATADNVTSGNIVSRPFGVKEYLQYNFQCRAKISALPTGNQGFYFRVVWYANDSAAMNPNGDQLSLTDLVGGGSAPFSSANAYQTFTVLATAPATARFARIQFFNHGFAKGSNTATTITVDTVTVQLQTITRSLYASVTGGTGINTFDTSYGNAIGQIENPPGLRFTNVAVSGSQPVLVIMTGSFAFTNSFSNGGYLYIGIRRNGVAFWEVERFFLNTELSGGTIPRPIAAHAIDRPAAGTYTYDISWHVDPDVGSGTNNAWLNQNDFVGANAGVIILP